MVLFTAFVALEVRRTDLTSDVVTTKHLVLVVIREALEGEFTLGADSLFVRENLLSAWRRHDDCEEGDGAGEWKKGC